MRIFRQFPWLAVLLAVSLCGCAEQNAEKELKQIESKLASGAQTTSVIENLQNLVSKFPGTKAATSAEQKLAVLRDKYANEVKETAAEADFAKLLEIQLVGSQPRDGVKALQEFIAKHPSTRASVRAEERIQALRPKLEEQERGESAQVEYTAILKAEQEGGDPKGLIEKYEALIAKYSGTDSATRAAERLASLKAKNKEAEAAKAAFESELARMMQALRADMVERAKAKALEEHPIASLSGKATATTRTPEKVAAGGDGKSWTIEQEYLVVVGATQSTRELVISTGTLRYNEFTRKFTAEVSAKLSVNPSP